MNKRHEKLCANSGLVFAVLMGLGIFGVAGWMPLVSPSLGAEEIAALFARDRTQIRIGMSILALSSVLWWSFSVAITMQMKRIEGASHPLAYLQMAAATGTVMAVELAAHLWLGGAFRAEIPAGTLQYANDVAWLMFVGAYQPALIQNLSIALCVLTDKSDDPVYPRWVGYMNLVTVLIYILGVLVPFTKTGPFAWNGILGFWIVALAFFVWIFLMWFATVGALRRQAAETVIPPGRFGLAGGERAGR